MPIGFDIVGGVISLIVYSVVIFGVFKIHQVAAELGEIKEVLRDIRRNTEGAPSLPHSAESLVRAVNSASYSEIAEQAATHSEPQH